MQITIAPSVLIQTIGAVGVPPLVVEGAAGRLKPEQLARLHVDVSDGLVRSFGG